MAHKPKIDQNFAPSIVTLGDISPQAITRSQIEKLVKGPTGFLAFLVPRLGLKNLKIALGNPPKILRKSPYQLAVFWPYF